jgi:hypothetical protein
MSHQLRRWGGDDAMRRLYATLYTRFRLRPIPPGSFQRMARELIAPPPDPLYRQLPRGRILYDDAVASARRDSLDDGRWRTTVIVERRAAGLFPQTVWVVAESDTGVGRAAALTPSETLSVVTRTRPRRVLLDPLVESHDWNMLNNQHAFGFRPAWLMLAPQRPVDGYLDTWFTRKTARNRLTVGWAPAVWYSDAGDWTFGTRVRQDYLGRFELNQLWASVNRTGVHGRLRMRNPVWLRAVGWSQSLELAWEEGRAAAGLEVTRRFRNRVADTSLRSLALGLHWLTVTDAAYPDPRFYDDAGTVELALTGRMGSLQASLATGHAYPNSGADIAGGIYGRVILSAAQRRPVGRRLTAGLRLFAGATIADDSVPRQRRIPLAGAGAYERFGSPLLRSRGSILARPGVFYHQPGGMGLRGLDPRVSSRHALGGSFELDYAVVDRAPGRLLGRMAVAAFADAGFADGDLDPGRDRLVAVADAGIGWRSDHRLGRTSFQIRFDLPLWVSRPALAQDGGPEHPIGFRWSFSFLPSF